MLMAVACGVEAVEEKIGVVVTRNWEWVIQVMGVDVDVAFELGTCWGQLK